MRENNALIASTSHKQSIYTHATKNTSTASYRRRYFWQHLLAPPIRRRVCTCVHIYTCTYVLNMHANTHTRYAGARVRVREGENHIPTTYAAKPSGTVRCPKRDRRMCTRSGYASISRTTTTNAILMLCYSCVFERFERCVCNIYEARRLSMRNEMQFTYRAQNPFRCKDKTNERCSRTQKTTILLCNYYFIDAFSASVELEDGGSEGGVFNSILTSRQNAQHRMAHGTPRSYRSV